MPISDTTDPTSFGTIATQNASNVTITGGTIDGAAIGATTPAVGSFTGLVVRNGGFSTTIQTDATSGNARLSNYTTNGLLRWQFGANGDTESGGNSGSSLIINRYNDAGSYLDTPLNVSRVSGQFQFGGSGGVYVNGNVGIGTASPGAKLDVNGTFNQTQATQNDFTIDGSGVAGAAVIKLKGNGVVTPSKYIRTNDGKLQFINDGYSAIPFSMDDAGNVAITGGLTAAGALKSASYTFATLPSASAAGAGARVNCSNCLVFNGTGTKETTGNGTGSPLYSNGTNWRLPGTNVTASA